MRLFVWILAFSALIACGKEPTKPTPVGKPTTAGKVPDVDDITNPPGLFPSPSDTPVRGLSEMGQPTMAELDAAAEVLWGSILITEKQDVAIVRALDGIKVLVSGLKEVDGKVQLYLGIDEKDFDKHDIEHLRAVLKSRFPAIPIFIEASEGVTLLRDMGGDDEEFVDVFADDFSEGIDGWDTGTTSDDGWQAETFSYPVPNEQAGNKVAVATSERCSADCAITTEAIDLSGYTSATLSFHRWIDDGLSGGEFLAVEVGSNGTYQRLETWEDDDGDDVWRYKTYTLDEKYLGEEITIRFITRLGVLDLSSLFSNSTPAEKIVAIDNVTVQGAQETQEEEEDEGSSLPDIAIYGVSATPSSVEGGTSVKVRFSIKNNGTTSPVMKNVRIYRHRSRKSNPGRGGTEAGRIPVFTPGSNASLTRTLSASTPTVSSTVTYYYYVCIDTVDNEKKIDNNCGGPAVVRVKAKTDDASEDTSTNTQTGTLTIQSISISPATLKSGETTTIRVKLHNSGSVRAASRTVKVYRHTTISGDPKSGTQVSSTTTTTGTVDAGKTEIIKIPVTAPTTTTQKKYYYAVCFGDLCTTNLFIPLTVKPGEKAPVVTPPVDNGPPYGNCYDVPERNTPMGGDVMLVPHAITTDDCGTITLGGLETKDGTKGFVVSAHVIAEDNNDPEAYTNTDIFVRHGRYNTQQGKTGLFLGKVHTMPRLHVHSELWNEYIIDADAAFVAYPSGPTAGCSLTWEDNGESFCLDIGKGDQIERVNPLTIRGKNGDIYTVTGSHQPKIGDHVLVSGAVSGADSVSGRVAGKLLVTSGAIFMHTYGFVSANFSIGGDSGSPVYTTPDTNGNVHIAGILFGDDGTHILFSPWNKVTEALNLKPID